jgi:hypothetical protein
LSHTTSFLRPLRCAQGPSCVSTHMAMPALSIQALFCAVMTMPLAVCSRYGRLKAVLAGFPFTLSSKVRVHIFFSQPPPSGCTWGSNESSTCTLDRSGPFTVHLMTMNGASMSPLPAPHMSAVKRALSSAEGALARDASSGTNLERDGGVRRTEAKT